MIVILFIDKKIESKVHQLTWYLLLGGLEATTTSDKSLCPNY